MSNKIQRRRQLSLSVVETDKVEERYGKDSLSWVVNGLLEQFNKLHEHTPQDYMKAGAEALKESIEDKAV